MNLEDIEEFQIVTNKSKEWVGLKLPDGKVIGTCRNSKGQAMDYFSAFGDNGNMDLDPILENLTISKVLQLILEARTKTGI